MTEKIRGIFRVATIVFLLLAGLAGTLFPVVPGFPFLIAAVALIAAESYAARKWLRLYRRRHRKWLGWMKVPHGHPPKGRPPAEVRRRAPRRGQTSPVLPG